MGLESYHPALELLYFAAAGVCALMFRHPVFVAIGFCGALACRRALWGRGLLWGLGLALGAVLFGLWYAGYQHFGVTLLGQTPIGNRITLESFLCGLSLGFTGATLLLWASCFHRVFSTDKTVYLFGRLWPRLSLFLAVLLRMVPRCLQAARRMRLARQGLGRDRGLRNRLRMLSALFTWTLDALFSVSAAMVSRGVTLPHRTAYALYDFDGRDRRLTLVLGAGLTLAAMAALLGQTAASYRPRILFAPVTPLSCLFYGAYALFCLLPLGLEVLGWARFAWARRRLS